jgi:uncharacterized integral membrane protein (TIGR00697 family)
LLVLVFYKLLGRTGLFIWVSIVAIIANIEVIKSIDIFGLPLTLGNSLFCSISLATDILNEKYGSKDARKSAWIGFLVLISFVILTQISLLFEPNAIDFSSDALNTIFSTTPRICIASLLCFLVSNIFDVYVFGWLRKKSRFLWVRVNVSTIISQLLDSVLFSFMAFLFIYPVKDILILSFTTYFIKVIITMCDTPFIYLSKRIKPL